ncbi:MerR family transcriptional regulator [Amycolatopsis sp. BJA-103]|uniref:MerR family transcriptional regulator n=1 Tax=Amycolatopsis sp. BJA-103 TaxID=1911175 RepID=UPI000C76C35A|nr:MerR family transcriptional regulator [Amycolatopsis sp. BJA-103]AUI58198.1 helix-turn-helix-type transcriptional regulator [Amycolatopsis sp. BJA-103]PNE13170.1 helix-turn-helix-type transcriptional regulator [Amycolatopsis sp. BJA-103]
MDVDEMSADAGAWTPGMVAEELGVSPVTLRTWASRYGVGPSLRAEGRHRRYSDADVRRLQHMQRLIGRGIRAREAAAAVFSGVDEALPEVSPDRRVGELEQASENLEFPTIAALLDETLDAMGAAKMWTEVLLPILRNLGGRWLRGDVCFEAEWALTTEVSFALQRYVARFAGVRADRSVLIACCPGERHSLPVEVLRASLAETGIPAVYLGHMVPAATTAGMVARLGPALVVLWSMSPATVDLLLCRRLQRKGFAVAVAGPGWKGLDVRGAPWVDDLAGALDLAAERSKA